MRISPALSLALSLALSSAMTPPAAVAASGNDWSPPKPTETTRVCKGKKVWDEKKKRCVRPRQSSLNQQELLGAARELAYAGRYKDAQAVLAAMEDQQDSLVLTYWGFTRRKLGNSAGAEAAYEQALLRDPDNNLARSYMGQGLVDQGKYGAALLQWREIRARGGSGSWAEVSLRKALETGASYGY